MADHTRNHGYRPGESSGRPRPGASAQPGGDPLAELARLIGQQNESAPSYRQNGRNDSYEPQAAPREAGWPAADPFTQQDSYRAPQAPAGYADGYPQQSQYEGYAPPSQYQDSQYDPRYDTGAPYGDSGYPGQTDQRYADPHYPDQRYADQYQDQRNVDPRSADPRYADPRYEEPLYSEPSAYASQPAAGHASGQGYSDPRFASGYEPQGYGQYPAYGNAPEPSAYAQHGYAQHGYAQGGLQQGYAAVGGQGYADPYYGGGMPAPAVASGEERAPRRRGNIVTVLAVLALAVVGTAGAFGYRAMFGTGGTPVPPPVIKADTRPSKVVPATDPNAKPIQDRIGGQAERVVSREEQPVAMPDPARPGAPRQISPNVTGTYPVNTGSTPTATTAAATSGPAEPKRIRTVPIKPDSPAETASTRAAPAPAARTASAQADDPIAARIQSAQPTGNAPLALQPAQPEPPAPATRQANQRTAAVSPFPTPISGATAGAPVAAGAYAVQVTSQRTEADAQASYKSLQQQFPSVLGSRQPVIKRADLGDKGTYYRAQIPFGSQTEASEFCSSLKAAGGQCVVQRN